MRDERFPTLNRHDSRRSDGGALVRPTDMLSQWDSHLLVRRQGTGFFCTSTLLPITPPRMAPAAPPMTAPFTLSRLVAAPMAAPATPPMMASRFVFFTVSVRGADVVVVLPALEPLEPEELLPDEVRRVEVRRAAVELVLAGAGRAATGAGATAAAVRSAALMESRRALLACAARPRSAFSEGSAGLSLLHAAANTNAGARNIVLRELRIVPPEMIGRGRRVFRINNKADAMPVSERCPYLRSLTSCLINHNIISAYIRGRV